MKQLLVAFMALLFLSSCSWRTIKGNGNVVTQTRSESDFLKVKSAGSFDLYVSQGNDFSVRIAAEKNLQKYIVTERRGNTLVIKVRRGVSLRPRHAIKVYVTAPVFKAVSIAGSGDITAHDLLRSSEKMVFEIAGSGNIRVADVDAPAIQVKIAGSGNVDLSGQTRHAAYRIAGGGNIRAGRLLAENATVHIAGSGNVWVYASTLLDVHIAGGGDVFYYGAPETINQKIAGSGRISKAQ